MYSISVFPVENGDDPLLCQFTSGYMFYITFHVVFVFYQLIDLHFVMPADEG